MDHAGLQLVRQIKRLKEQCGLGTAPPSSRVDVLHVRCRMDFLPEFRQYPIFNVYREVVFAINDFRNSDVVYTRPDASSSIDVSSALSGITQLRPSRVPHGLKPLVDTPQGDKSELPYLHVQAAASIKHPFSMADSAADPSLDAAISSLLRLGSSAVEYRKLISRALKHFSKLLRPLDDILYAKMPQHVFILCGSQPLSIFGAMMDAVEDPDMRMIEDFVFGFRSIGEIPDSGVYVSGGKDFEASTHDVLRGNASYASRVANQVLRDAKRDLDTAKEVLGEDSE